MEYEYTKVKVQPFNWTMYLTTNKEHVIHWLCENGAHPEDFAGLEDCHGSFLEFGGKMIMVLPEKYDEETIWHEALHAATFMWDLAGANLHVMHNDEVLTYMQGHIVRLVKEAIYQ